MKTHRQAHILHLLALGNYSRMRLSTYHPMVHWFSCSVTYISFHLSLQHVTIWNVLYSTCSLLLHDIIEEDLSPFMMLIVYQVTGFTLQDKCLLPDSESRDACK